MKSEKIRTRIAPSPTGLPHLGFVYISLFNYVFARKNSGQFIFRLEDTDRDRFLSSAEEELYKALDWFGLKLDESPNLGGPYAPYRQSERLELYKENAKKLIDDGNAYYCFCTAERLNNLREQAKVDKKPYMYDRHCLNLSKSEIDEKLKNNDPHVVRLKSWRDRKIVCNDLLRGEIEFDANIIDDQILMKSDGFPTYHLAVVVDDNAMEITHILRGHEWISSLPKHVMLYEMFGFKKPIFAHFPVILSADKKGKLSKREDASSISFYKNKGYLPEAVLNYLALQGWSHPDGKDIFDINEFTEKFEIKDMSTSLPKFDIDKLNWINSQYIYKLSNEKFIEKVIEWANLVLSDKNIEDRGDYENLLKFLNGLSLENKEIWAEINKNRIKIFADLISLNSMFYIDVKCETTDLIKQKTANDLKPHLEWVKSIMTDRTLNADLWTLENLKQIELQVKDRASELNWKVAEVFYPIRIAITGSSVSLPLFESIYLLGKDKTLDRLQQAIDRL